MDERPWLSCLLYTSRSRKGLNSAKDKERDAVAKAEALRAMRCTLHDCQDKMGRLQGEDAACVHKCGQHRLSRNDNTLCFQRLGPIGALCSFGLQALCGVRRRTSPAKLHDFAVQLLSSCVELPASIAMLRSADQRVHLAMARQQLFSPCVAASHHETVEVP